MSGAARRQAAPPRDFEDGVWQSSGEWSPVAPAPPLMGADLLVDEDSLIGTTGDLPATPSSELTIEFELIGVDELARLRQRADDWERAVAEAAECRAAILALLDARDAILLAMARLARFR